MTGFAHICDRQTGIIGRSGTSIDRETTTGFARLDASRFRKDGHTFDIVGEWRPDNAPEMRGILNLPGDASLEHIVAAGWVQWNRDLADHLRGPFSIALFDHGTREFYAGRDAFGLLPFFYHLRRNLICFGRNSRAVRMQSGDAWSPNIAMIADFLVGQEVDKEATYFEGLHKLAPGTWLSVTARSHKTHRYWSPRSAPAVMDRPDAAFEFRRLFDRSVKNCHRPGNTSLMFSGGLDSSAIAASLVHQGLAGAEFPTISLTYRGNEGWTDGSHIDRLNNEYGFVRHELPSAAHDPLDGIVRYLRDLDGPYIYYGHSVSFRLQALSRKLGYGCVMSGHGGDEIVSHGFGRLNELAKERKLVTLWRETGGPARLHSVPRMKIFQRYLHHLPPYRRIAKRLARFRQFSVDQSGHQPRSLLSPPLADVALSARYVDGNPLTRLDHTERSLHEWLLDQPIQANALDIFAIASETDGVVTSMPFYDRDLAEFSLSLPAHWKLDRGVTRRIMREAIADAMPPATLNRADKFNFARNFVDGLLADRSRLFDLTNPNDSAIAPYIAADRVKEMHVAVLQKGTGIDIHDAYALWRIAVLHLWLRDAA